MKTIHSPREIGRAADALSSLPQVVRTACVVCDTHTNAVKTLRVIGCCPNCGSFDLATIEGAEPLGSPLAA